MIARRARPHYRVILVILEVPRVGRWREWGAAAGAFEQRLTQASGVVITPRSSPRRAAGRGEEVVVLTRSPQAGVAARQVAWGGRTACRWAEELAGAVVVNLAGAIVDRRPTAANVRLLTDSRVQPTLALATAADEETLSVVARGLADPGQHKRAEALARYIGQRRTRAALRHTCVSPRATVTQTPGSSARC